MADAEELKENTASGVYVKRFKESGNSKKAGEQFTSPCADGYLKLPEDGHGPDLAKETNAVLKV